MDGKEFKFETIEGGYRCDLPGALLVHAQKDQVKIALADGGSVSLSDNLWRDHAMQRQNYVAIELLKFDPAAWYTVRWICRGQGLVTKYLFAVRK